MKGAEIEILFSDLEVIVDVNKIFLERLEERFLQFPANSLLGEIFITAVRCLSVVYERRREKRRRKEKNGEQELLSKTQNKKQKTKTKNKTKTQNSFLSEIFITTTNVSYRLLYLSSIIDIYVTLVKQDQRLKN